MGWVVGQVKKGDADLIGELLALGARPDDPAECKWSRMRAWVSLTMAC